MAVKHIPDGFHSITPYLTVPGVAKLLEFLACAFGAKELERMTDPTGRVAHAEVLIGDSHVMLGEPGPAWTSMPSTLYLYVEDADAVYKAAIEAGAKSLMPPTDMFYGDRHGGVKDPSGNLWWIATHIEDVSPDELKRRAQAQGK